MKTKEPREGTRNMKQEENEGNVMSRRRKMVKNQPTNFPGPGNKQSRFVCVYSFMANWKSNCTLNSLKRKKGDNG